MGEDDGESSICFENTDLHQYSSEQIKNTNHSPLRFQDTTSDEVLNTQDNHEEQNAIAFGHSRMKSPDVKKLMNKAYLFMNSKVARSSMHNSEHHSTPSRRYMTP